MTSFKYFKREDFNCQHTGKNEMQDSFIRQLDKLREVCGFPFIVTSGYRDKTHPAEKIKKTPGTGKHCQGIAADIRVSGGAQRAQITKFALQMGFSVGPSKTFVHVDKRTTQQMLWVY